MDAQEELAFLRSVAASQLQTIKALTLGCEKYGLTETTPVVRHLAAQDDEIERLRAELAECRADAEKWRRMRSFARVLFERDGGHVLGACAIHIAVAAHDVGSDSARFEMDGVTDSDGRPCGDWLVTVARKGEEE